MRIAIDYTVGIYQGSGVGRYARTLVRALAATEREIDFTLLWARARGNDGQELPHLDRFAGYPANFRSRRLPLRLGLRRVGWLRRLSDCRR